MMNEAIKLSFKNKERTLLFGIGPSRILCEDKGITVTGMQGLDTNELIQDMIFASLKFDCFLKNEEVDFSKWEVYKWINDMEQDTFQRIFEVFIHTRTLGQSIYSTWIKNLEKEQGSHEGQPQPAKKKTRRGMI